MVSHFACIWVLACLVLPVVLRGDLVFRCPSCSAERQAACPRLTTTCVEIVREPGCGCCPVCARLEGELCGVYTPRCSTGFRCYPSADSALPLEELVKGLGHCSKKVDMESTVYQEYQDTSVEVPSTDSPNGKRPTIDGSPWLRPKESAVRQHQNDLKSKMKKTRQDMPRSPQEPPQSPCEQELHNILEAISKMTFPDKRGLLENLYDLKFPNCDMHGNFNLKQCNISTHGQRGECWCVNPVTGIQIPTSPKVRGNPNCNSYLEEQDVNSPSPTSVVPQEYRDLTPFWRTEVSRRSVN